MYFAHAVRRQVLLEIRSGGEGFLAKLTLPRLALVVDALYVDPHVVSAHELFVTMRTGDIRDTGRRATNLKYILFLIFSVIFVIFRNRS